jgi:transcriptional regulator with XRE-family HTH domain
MSERRGWYLRKWRKRARLTQVALADQMGVGSDTISRYESGERWPDIEDLHRMAAALGCPPWALLIDPDHRPTEVAIGDEVEMLNLLRSLDGEALEFLRRFLSHQTRQLPKP